MNETWNVLITKSEFSFISILHVPSIQQHLWIPKSNNHKSTTWIYATIKLTPTQYLTC